MYRFIIILYLSITVLIILFYFRLILTIIMYIEIFIVEIYYYQRLIRGLGLSQPANNTLSSNEYMGNALYSTRNI